jgi:hypothetical protein
VSEARAGETLTLRSAAAPGVTYIEGVNGGAVVFRAQLTTAAR